MISRTSADLRRAVQRLISSSITSLIGVSSGKVTPEQEISGSLQGLQKFQKSVSNSLTIHSQESGAHHLEGCCDQERVQPDRRWR
jgi:hypothetical protein